MPFAQRSDDTGDTDLKDSRGKNAPARARGFGLRAVPALAVALCLTGKAEAVEYTFTDFSQDITSGVTISDFLGDDTNLMLRVTAFAREDRPGVNPDDGSAQGDGDTAAELVDHATNGLGIRTPSISDGTGGIESGRIARRRLGVNPRIREILQLEFSRAVDLTAVEIWHQSSSTSSSVATDFALRAVGAAEIAASSLTQDAQRSLGSNRFATDFTIAEGQLRGQVFHLIGTRHENTGGGNAFGVRLLGVTAAAAPPPAIPLPGALPLFLTGLAGLGLVGRMRRRAA